MSAIVVTWPKTKPLEGYLRALANARQNAQVINFRVARLPRVTPMRCYRVYDGAVRGWTSVVELVARGERQVADPDGGYWPAGNYIACSPWWHAIDPIPMRGFQGWRWFERPS